MSEDEIVGSIQRMGAYSMEKKAKTHWRKNKEILMRLIRDFRRGAGNPESARVSNCRILYYLIDIYPLRIEGVVSDDEVEELKDYLDQWSDE